MATNLRPYFADLNAQQVIGDNLKRPELYIKDGNGDYVSWTGYTLSSILYDAFGNSVATPAITATTGTPPNETAAVTDGLIQISDVPANLPTKAGVYLLVVKAVETAVVTNVETIIRIRYNFVAPDFDL